mmetsp:Transcript_71560/g.232625  ORF Transcript_71560/g.232625 Transcript_71560/m.232625 type:complete len:216 (+) Transcript_71560:1237-1884(+)
MGSNSLGSKSSKNFMDLFTRSIASSKIFVLSSTIPMAVSMVRRSTVKSMVSPRRLSSMSAVATAASSNASSSCGSAGASKSQGRPPRVAPSELNASQYFRALTGAFSVFFSSSPKEGSAPAAAMAAVRCSTARRRARCTSARLSDSMFPTRISQRLEGQPFGPQGSLSPRARVLALARSRSAYMPSYASRYSRTELSRIAASARCKKVPMGHALR